MALFLVRSLVCIGLVAAAASGGGADRVVRALGRGGRDAAGDAARACAASDACRRLGAAALERAAPRTPDVRPPASAVRSADAGRPRGARLPPAGRPR